MAPTSLPSLFTLGISPVTCKQAALAASCETPLASTYTYTAVVSPFTN